MCLPYDKINIKGISRLDWLKLRQTGIGGSDAPVICGVDDYKTIDGLIEDKLAQTFDDTPNLACRHGTHCEPLVAELFTEASGLQVQRSNFMYRSKGYPFMLANIDRKIIGQNAGLECKTANAFFRNKYSKSCLVPANDDGDCPFPYKYYIQALHYLAVTGWDKWYLAVLIGNMQFEWYEIERDERNIQFLIEQEINFHETLQNERKQRSVKHA